MSAYLLVVFPDGAWVGVANRSAVMTFLRVLTRHA